MKCLLLMILAPAIVFSQDKSIIETKLLSSCNLYDAPALYGNTIKTLDEGSYCIVMDILQDSKSASGINYWYVITLEGNGYIMESCLKLNDSITMFLKNDKTFFEDRVARSKAYFELNKLRLFDSVNIVMRRTLDKKLKDLAHIKDSLSKYNCFIDFWFERNILDYPDISLSILNLNKFKSIKYVWFTVNGYNPVDDIEGTKTVQGIGPVKPFEKGSYTFRSILRKTTITKMEVSTIKVQYMDGTIKVIPKRDIKVRDLAVF